MRYKMTVTAAATAWLGDDTIIRAGVTMVDSSRTARRQHGSTRAYCWALTLMRVGRMLVSPKLVLFWSLSRRLKGVKKHTIRAINAPITGEDSELGNARRTNPTAIPGQIVYSRRVVVVSQLTAQWS